MKFHGTENSEEGAKAEAKITKNNELFIGIECDNLSGQSITLDKRTAIKFCRQIRSVIAQLED